MTRSLAGQYIRYLRVKKDLTQAELAERLNITDKAVSKWERGLSFPDILLLPKLAEVLGVSVGDLISRYDERHAEDYYRGDPAEMLVPSYEMSSDLRAPLHIILGCSELIRLNRDDSDKIDRYLEAIRVSGEYLLWALNKSSSDTDAAADEDFEKYHRRYEYLYGFAAGGDAEEGPAAADEARTAANEVVRYDFSGNRILVVDDMAVNREILAAILRQTGAEIEFAEGGQECVDLVARRDAGCFDLILMDLLMPGMDGIEAAKRIRGMADREKALIPMIAVTSNVRNSEREAAYEAGMNAFTEKPILIDKLFATIKQFL
ncbi:MAG: response regulator [Mogibacterium sp.]|nr:response regulator [Mogibacterium sp.]